MKYFYALALSVVLAAPHASAVDNLVPGTSTQIIPLQDARFKAVAPTSFPIPTSGGADDPTITGGSVRFFDTADPMGNEIVFALAPGDWTDIGHGFRYNGMGGPCEDVKVTDNQLEIQCGGAMVTLTTPFAGQVGVTITVGTTPIRYCAVLGGSVIANSAAGVKRAHSPAPAVCEPAATPFEQPMTGKSAVIRTMRGARFLSRDVAVLPDAGGDAPTAVRDASYLRYGRDGRRRHVLAPRARLVGARRGLSVQGHRLARGPVPARQDHGARDQGRVHGRRDHPEPTVRR